MGWFYLVVILFSIPVYSEDMQRQGEHKCATYNGKACKNYLDTSSSVWFNISAESLHGGLNEQIVKDLWEEVIKDLKEPCRSAAERLLCTYAFPLCVIHNNDAIGLPLCYDDCVAVRDSICYNDWARIESNKEQGIFIRSRGHFTLPNCSALPRLSPDKKVCSHARITETKKNEVTYDCIKGRGRFYLGTMNTTKSGLPCQRWDSNKPHSHDNRPPDVFPEIQNAENYCRNAGGEEPVPWCYTMDPDVRWQHCNIPLCENDMKTGGFLLSKLLSTHVMVILAFISATGIVIGLLIVLICNIILKNRLVYRPTATQEISIDLEKLPNNSAYHKSGASLNPKLEKLEFPRNDIIYIKDLGQGAFGRVFQACGDTKSKPAFLSDKTLESSIKYIVRKFPHIDLKGLQGVNHLRSEIIKSLSLYYYTFVDLLDFRDNVSEILTTIDACKVHLDITLNFELTKAYLDLVVTYATLMKLLSRVEDRKAVLGLFNAAHEMVHNQGDISFPRLGQMITEYDNPMKKLYDEFYPHAELLHSALLSLWPVYVSRNIPADKWRSDQKLSLVGNPSQLLKPSQTETMSCEYLSLETLERWIIFGFMLCHHKLNKEQSNKLWLMALENSWVITLFRDEVIYIHAYIQNLFDGIKGYGKRVSEVKDCYNQAIQKATYRHRERRKFLRSSLKELGLIFTDQPGLLGPKALLIFIGLSFAKDEVHWLLRHNDNPPQQKSKGKISEDLVDRQLPELLFHMEELRVLVRKYSQVIQRYYVQYLSGFDAIALNKMMPNLAVCPEDENIILSSIYKSIANLSVKQVEDNELFDFRALRLDWFRLQAYTSVSKSPLSIMNNKDLASLLDTIIFHTKMVDYLDEIVIETSDLSIFCFYSKIFEDQFHMCLEFPAQNRYIIAFPLICNHFQSCTHELCPEERHHIRERSLSVVNMFLDEMAKEAKNIITTICDEQCTMSDKLLPKHCAMLISQVVNRKRKDKNKKITPEFAKPGVESYRKTREDLTTMDKLHMALTELCFALNYCSTVNVWEYTFAPREYLHQHLENRFARALVGMVMFNPDTSEIAKPSELLASVRAYMNVLQTVENYVHIDITRVFNNALLQQTQQVDSHGDKTVAALYTQWYSEVLLRRVSAGNICFSLNQRAFVSLTAEGAIPFNAEEFSDINELRSLGELIGPYGMKLLNETLMWHIASQVQELKKLVAGNKEVLIALRTNFDKPEIMKEQFKKLQHVDNVLQRMTIVGVILSFRQLAQSALVDVLEQRIPFLLSSILDFRHHAPAGDFMAVSEMASAAGLPCQVDPTLAAALRNQKNETDEDEHLLACLLMVFVAVSIPKLARNDSSFYRASLEGHSNNIHCMASAINNIFGALFTICSQRDIEDRMKEFLALASSSLLRLGQEADREIIKNRESVYLLLDQIVQESPFLTMDLLESCFPYALIRNAYHAVYKQEHSQT